MDLRWQSIKNKASKTWPVLLIGALLSLLLEYTPWWAWIVYFVIMGTVIYILVRS